MAGVIAFGNFRERSTHATDLQVQQQEAIQGLGAQVKSLQDQINHQALVLAAVSEFKDDTQTRLNRIEGKIDRELQYHAK